MSKWQIDLSRTLSEKRWPIVKLCTISGPCCKAAWLWATKLFGRTAASEGEQPLKDDFRMPASESQLLTCTFPFILPHKPSWSPDLLTHFPFPPFQKGGGDSNELKLGYLNTSKELSVLKYK